jgi:hypothetical protein
LFSKICLSYYDSYINSTILEGTIEVDESHLFRPKKTATPHRSLTRSIWILGFKKRHSGEFLLIPMTSREEAFIHLSIVKHVQPYSTIVTDSYCAYVNNHVVPRKSKLEKYQFCHQWVNHRVQFVGSLFNDINTNSVENLWRFVKGDIKKTHTTTKYCYGIARFTFTKNLTKIDQVKYICEALLQDSDFLH